jgi:hypothetical protein
MLITPCSLWTLASPRAAGMSDVPGKSMFVGTSTMVVVDCLCGTEYDSYFVDR